MFLSSVLQEALTSILSIVLDGATLALREGQLPADLKIRPALTLLRLLAAVHQQSGSPLLLQLQLVAGLQGLGGNTLRAVANAAIMHKQALQWEQGLSSGAFPAVLHLALEKQVAALAQNQLTEAALSVYATKWLQNMRLDSIYLLGQDQLAFIQHLQAIAAAALRERFPSARAGPRQARPGRGPASRTEFPIHG